jgi:glutamate-1-semialdehyde 2,1-aminomutase
MSTAGVDLVAGSTVDAVIAEETERFLARQPRGRTFIERASRSLAGGATSSWQIAQPQAVWLSHGVGPKVYDVDGTEYSDFHGGYGACLVGHAHPAIVAAVSDRVTRGTHFAQPTEDAIVAAENLADRFGLPLWRFANSGTEATMDAVHLMRAATGRDRIIKVEGCYHGHHDSVQVSVAPAPGDDIGPASAPTGVPSSTGIPRAITDLVSVVPYNDVDAVERVLTTHRGEVAGMILEPIMMNAGIIHPQEGYLAALREVLHRHRALLTFDEVKTGFTVGPGGVTRASGILPDLVCLAKSLGGGVPTAALGGTDALMSLIAEGRYEQVGTFNGNPLVMAAVRATLTEVLTPEAYRHLDRLRERLESGLGDAIAESGMPWQVVTAGAKGCVSFRSEPVRDYREFVVLDSRYGHAHWLAQHNGGVFLPPWGKVEQWLVSVQHQDEDIDRLVSNFGRLLDRLTVPDGALPRSRPAG